MKIYIRRISRRLKNLREEQKLTQEELAERLGISRQSIISVERGRSMPSLPLALRIANIFSRSLEDLFLDEDSSKQERGGVRSMPKYLMPWTPFGDIDRIFEDEDWSSPRLRMRTLITPPVNVRQTEKEIVVTVDIPGVKEEDLQIEVGENFIDISGERKEETEEKDEGYYRKEVNYGSFQRRIPMPAEVIADKAEATIKEGQLRIVVTKVEPIKPKVTKIKIKKG